MSLFRRTSDNEADPHAWQLSNKSRSWGFGSKAPTVIPDARIFRDVFIPYMEVLKDKAAPALVQYPTAGQLAVHLCLSECFHKFRKAVESSDMFEDLAPPTYQTATNTRTAKQDSHAGPLRASQKWEIVAKLAIVRFKVWFEKIENVLRHASFYNRLGTSSHSRGAFSRDYLPPLDVLLVWYSYMNRPEVYRSDNRAHSTTLLLDVCMPWDSIMEVIDRDTFTYNLPGPAEALFRTLTSQSADILTYLKSPPVYSNLDEQKSISVDLGQVLRDQLPFFEKMHEFLWIRSPALEGTLNRNLLQYSALAEAIDGRVASWRQSILSDPALELVWRTHKLYPAAYDSFCERAFGSDGSKTMMELEQNIRDVKLATLSEDDENGDNDDNDEVENEEDTAEVLVDLYCSCWLCERVRDDDPSYARPLEDDYDSDEKKQNRLSLTISRCRDRRPSVVGTIPRLSKEQIDSIKADVTFHRHVESFRASNLSGAPLPTRPPTKAELARQKEEKEKRERAGRYYGLGYSVEVISPAIYDKNGKLVKSERTKVRRSKVMHSAFPISFK